MQQPVGSRRSADLSCRSAVFLVMWEKVQIRGRTATYRTGRATTAHPSPLAAGGNARGPLLVAGSNEDILREMGARKFIENEGSSGDIHENKEGQVSGIRCQVSGAPTIGCLMQAPCSRLGLGNCGTNT